jgi:hypothetical protein
MSGFNYDAMIGTVLKQNPTVVVFVMVIHNINLLIRDPPVVAVQLGGRVRPWADYFKSGAFSIYDDRSSN